MDGELEGLHTTARKYDRRGRNPHFLFQRGVTKSSWFCSSHTTLTNTAKKKSEAQIRTGLTQTCAILASDFCW